MFLSLALHRRLKIIAFWVLMLGRATVDHIAEVLGIALL
jgi:hypothetical protein